MRNAIIATHRLDLPPAVHLRSVLGEAGIHVFDPQMLDRARFEGIADARLIKWVSRSGAGDDYRKAGQQAAGVEQAVEQILGKIFPEAVGCRWLYHTLFYLFYTVNRYSGLADAVLKEEADVHLHIPMGDKPFRYGYPSFLQALLLIERLIGSGKPYSAYSYELPAVPPDAVPADFGALGKDYDIFAHLPTCFYDAAFFDAEMAASTRQCLNFKAQYWDVPLPSLDAVQLCPADQLFSRLSPARQVQMAEALVRIREVLAGVLKQFIATGDYVARQVDCLVGMCRTQMVFHEALVERFAAHRPRKLLLSNHDGGLHGPFLSFARRFAIPVLFVPHSKIFNGSVAARSLDVRCLTHPIQGGEVVDEGGRRLPTDFIGFPETVTADFAHPKKLESVGLILSSISYNGLCGVDPEVYLAGVRKISDWCKENGVTCRIRCKPTDSFIHWLVEALGLDHGQLQENLQGNILDFARANDLCLMYDAPTSGAVDLLKNGIPVLNPVGRPLIPEEERLVSSDLVPRGQVEEILARMGSFVADTGNLFVFRRQQFQRYVAAQSQALPLRMFL